MYVSDDFVFLELHKTGCSHIRRILAEVTTGERVGKHNPMPREMAAQKVRKLGSVRNPWEWYVSLWAYGCDKRGSLRQRLVDFPRLKVREIGWKNNCQATLREFISIALRDRQEWSGLYSDVNNTENFRRWLRKIHEPSNRYLLGEEYGYFPLSQFTGLMTYRYLRLFCCFAEDYRKLDQIRAPGDLMIFDQQHNFVTHFIRNESLESDLAKALAGIDLTLSENLDTYLSNLPRSNTSSRSRSINDFYDAETYNLVLERDGLLIEKFHYSNSMMASAA